MNNGKWGMIDKSRKQLVPMQFDGMLRMQDGFAAVEKNGKVGFVNRAGKLKIPIQYKRARSFHNGFAAVQFQNDTWGYINKTGKVVWQDKSGRVTQLGDFHEDYAKVQGKVGNELLMDLELLLDTLVVIVVLLRLEVGIGTSRVGQLR